MAAMDRTATYRLLPAAKHDFMVHPQVLDAIIEYWTESLLRYTCAPSLVSILTFLWLFTYSSTVLNTIKACGGGFVGVERCSEVQVDSNINNLSKLRMLYCW